jgi:glycosyltransferase involved in cell wall biosynthesis
MAKLNQDKPLISAITIFFNGEKYISEAIESVLAQTYDHWELLLVDDGSSDRSTAIALEYVHKFPQKIRYLEHEDHQNRGMSATRNLGIKNAKGDYITFLDADDIWLREKLESQLATLIAQPEAGAVFGPTLYWYSWADNSPENPLDEVRELGITPNQLWQPPQLLAPLIRRQINTPATCSILLRREVFNIIGGFEEGFRGMFEDQAFFAKMYLKTPVFVESKCLDKYRQHLDSTCFVTQTTGEYHPVKPNPAYQAYLNWLENYLVEQKVEDAEIWQALEKRLWPYKHLFLGNIYYSLADIYYRTKDNLRIFWKQKLPFPLPRWLQPDKAKNRIEE